MESIDHLPITIPPAPRKVDNPQLATIMMMVIPMLGSLAIAGFMAMSRPEDHRYLVMALIMGASVFGVAGINLYRHIFQFRHKVLALRRNYLTALAPVRTQLWNKHREQLTTAQTMLPSFQALPLKLGWNPKEPESNDSITFRAGTAVIPLEHPINLLSAETTTDRLESQPAEPDHFCQRYQEKLHLAYGKIPDHPWSIQLRYGANLSVLSSSPSTAHGFVRTIVAQAALSYTPTELQIGAVISSSNRAEWEWLKWLPHAQSRTTCDRAGPARLVASSWEGLTNLLGVYPRSQKSARSDNVNLLLVITDQDSSPVSFQQYCQDHHLRLLELKIKTGKTEDLQTNRGLAGLPKVKFDPRPGHKIHQQVGSPITVPAQYWNETGASFAFNAELSSIIQAESFARRLETSWADNLLTEEAEIRLLNPDSSVLINELLGIPDLRDFDYRQTWTKYEGGPSLRVPFGLSPEGSPVYLDLKELARGGMGPHGLLVGATGSGKSEVLRTIVLALSLTHSPEQLNFVLVDFKGGATFNTLKNLPHVSAMISNLESEAYLVSRTSDALLSEISRRQTLLRNAGNYANLDDYESDRRKRIHNFPPQPALFIVLDEFAELMSVKPELGELFVTIGRIGRSLAVHMLLATQTYDEGKLRSLDAHLSYRIGLRTFSRGESLAFLGTDQASELANPGDGYLRTADQILARFKACYVSGPLPRRFNILNKTSPRESLDFPEDTRIVPFTSSVIGALKSADTSVQQLARMPPADVRESDLPWLESTQIDVVVKRMSDCPLKAHKIWLPPLENSSPLDDLFGGVKFDPSRGLVGAKWKLGRLSVPLGITDLPREQKQGLAVYDFAANSGHFAVVGGPRSGKSTTLSTAILALTLLNTPLEVQLYLIDLGGASLRSFSQSVHVCGYAARTDKNTIRRIVDELKLILIEREKYFQINRIDSIEDYRLLRQAGNTGDGYGDVFLVIDSWEVLHSEFEEEETILQTLLSQASAFGFHLLLSATRWASYTRQFLNLLDSRLELRINDPFDSIHSRQLAQTLPRSQPGHGLTEEGHRMLGALPYINSQKTNFAGFSCTSEDNASLALLNSTGHSATPETNSTRTSPPQIAEELQKTLMSVAKAWPGPSGPKLHQLPELLLFSSEDGKTLPDDHSRHHQNLSVAYIGQSSSREKIVLGIEESKSVPAFFNCGTEEHLYVLGDTKSGKTSFLRSLAFQLMKSHTPKEIQFIVVDYRRQLVGEIPDEYLAGYCVSSAQAKIQIADVHQYLSTRLSTSPLGVNQPLSATNFAGAKLWVLVDTYDLVTGSSGDPLLTLEPLLAQSREIGLHLVITRRTSGTLRAMHHPILRTLTDLQVPVIMLSGSPDEGLIISGHKPQAFPPGRAQVISRNHGKKIVQLVFQETII